MKADRAAQATQNSHMENAMNAIAPVREDFSCDTSNASGNADSTVVRPDAGHVPCSRNSGNQGEIKIGGWGGSRVGAGRKPKPPVVETPLGLRWYVVETHPSAEHLAVRDLCRSGWRAYLPLMATRKRDRVLPTLFHKVAVPLFRGYLFVEFDRDSQTWGTIRDQCGGVRGIIKDGRGRPHPAPHGFVQGLMDDDANRLELKSNAQKPRDVGAKVRIETGPMTSFYGMVMACDGLTTTVNVELFGRMVPVEMAYDHIEVVD